MAQKTTTFGLKAGIISSGMNGDAMENLNKLLDLTNGMAARTNNTGFFAGLNSNIPLGENFSLEPGLYFSRKGSQITGTLAGKAAGITGAAVKSVFQADYIDMPILMKVNFGGLQLFAGPQVSYLTQARLKTTAGVLGINLLNNTIDATDVLHQWDAGVTGGIGYEFLNGMNLSASFDQGLLKTDRNRQAAAYNQAFKIGIGINL